MKLINFLHQQPFRTTAFLKYGPCPGSFFILKLYNIFCIYLLSATGIQTQNLLASRKGCTSGHSNCHSGRNLRL